MNATPQTLKRLVIQSTTGRLLKNDGGWTFDESEARAFEDITALVRSCWDLGVTNAEALLRFNNDPRFDIRFPLCPNRA